MANYPEWLMHYKTKGIYVKRAKEEYALYRGHSERVEEKNYPVFKCDEDPRIGMDGEYSALRCYAEIKKCNYIAW